MLCSRHDDGIVAKHFRPVHTPFIPCPSLRIRELKTHNMARASRLKLLDMENLALMKDTLWTIVDETEAAPDGSYAAASAKFVARRDRALVVIVLSVAPSLLYLIGDPKNPVAVWIKLADQFQKNSWANKLELRRLTTVEGGRLR